MRILALPRLPSSGFRHFHRYYPAVRLPVHHRLCLVCSLRLPYSFILHGTHRLSPVDVTSLYDMTGSPTPRQCITASHGAATHVAFPYFYQVSLPDSTHFGIQSFALSPCCLRLADTVTSIHPRLATNDAATSYWAGFPPAKCHTLSWAHGSLSKYLPQVSSFLFSILDTKTVY